MTALRQEANQMMENLPEEGLLAIIEYMRHYKAQQTATEQRLAKKKLALEKLIKLSKAVPGLDYKKELSEYREERFRNAKFS